MSCEKGLRARSCIEQFHSVLISLENSCWTHIQKKHTLQAIKKIVIITEAQFVYLRPNAQERQNYMGIESTWSALEETLVLCVAH